MLAALEEVIAEALTDVMRAVYPKPFAARIALFALQVALVAGDELGHLGLLAREAEIGRIERRASDRQPAGGAASNVLHLIGAGMVPAKR